MGSARNQFIATVVVNILVFAHGCGLGWSSPAIPYFASNKTHLNGGPSTTSDLSWIGSAVSIGSLVMTIIAGFIDDFVGKRKTLMFLAIPNLIFWVMVYTANEAYEIIIARFIAGLTGGGIFRVLSLYTADISENHVRGALSAIFPLAMFGGMLIMFIMGAYLDYFTVPLIMIAFPIIGFILMIFIPDTPHFLIKHKKYEDAMKALKFYRTCSVDVEQVKKVEDEFQTIKSAIENVQTEKLSINDFKPKSAIIGILVGVFLVFQLTFSGNLILMLYTSYIFLLTGSSLNPNDSAIIVAAMQIIGIFMMGALVDKFGRKILMVISCIGSATTLLLMSIFLMCKDSGSDVHDYTWAPLTLTSLTIFFQSLGISSLPFVMISELVPFKIREFFALVCMIVISIFMFITLKLFPGAVQSVGITACFWFFTVVCFIGIFVSIFFMKETKGKDLYENYVTQNRL